MTKRKLLPALINATALIGALVFSVPAVAHPGTPGCADLGGMVGAEHTCHIHTETSTYTIDIGYPLDYPDQQALTDFVTHDRDQFVDFMAQARPRDYPYGHGLTPHAYRSGASTSGTQSVVFDVHDDTGAHPVTGFKAFNYDLSARTAITLATLFKRGADPVATLDPIVQRYMNKRRQSTLEPPPHNTLGAEVYQNFAITDDAIIFFIGQGMWLPEVDGPQRVRVSRSELAAVLA
ncbi:Protein of uncharacterised function (DUF3298) [Mycobacteroides abscessus subsp. abscessus]|nr:Protein of uncharacterised function (DUF3298) [Mycobacteroides abscessus subsp. abscessus]